MDDGYSASTTSSLGRAMEENATPDGCLMDESRQNEISSVSNGVHQVAVPTHLSPQFASAAVAVEMRTGISRSILSDFSLALRMYDSAAVA